MRARDIFEIPVRRDDPRMMTEAERAVVEAALAWLADRTGRARIVGRFWVATTSLEEERAAERADHESRPVCGECGVRHP
jgi:hypothetical protein